MNINYENSDDMQRLQQEAIRRVREMQSRAKLNIENTNQEVINKSKNQNDCKPKKEEDHIRKEKVVQNQEYKGPNVKTRSNNIHKEECITQEKHKSSPVDIMGSIMQNKDQNLILILILILSGEEADAGLILALLYLMM